MIENLLKIPAVERQLFTRHFIKNVVIEFNFVELFQNLIINNKNTLKEAFKNLGFQSNEIQQVQFALGISDEKPEVKTSDEVVGFVFENNEEKIRIELIENQLIINVFKYQNFDNFFIKVDKIVNIVLGIIPANKQISKIVLKKVNTIVSTETTSFEDLTSILNSNFFSILKNNIIPFENFTSCSDMFEVTKNTYKCKVYAKCKKRNVDKFEITLDITICHELKENNINIPQILENINNTNFSIFHWVTTDYFKQIMNEDEV